MLQTVPPHHLQKSRIARPSFVVGDLTASICRKSYFEFFKEFWDVVNPSEKLDLNWHLEFLCDEVQEITERVMAGENKEHDLLVNISPGTSKSMICSIFLQAWSWTRMPHFRWICGSHTESLVLDLSMKCRDIVLSEKYKTLFPDIEIRSDQGTKAFWKNTKGGFRFSCTVGGKTPTGFHAHAIVIDDPLDPKKAASDLELKTANDWMESTLPSRKVNKEITPTILVMQRLNQGDPAGNMLEKREKGYRVRHICLPAEVHTNIAPAYLRHRYKHGLMDPKRLGYAVLKDFQIEGDYYYSSQFLQEPTPLGGGMFKTDRIKIDIPPDRKNLVTMCRFWDKAATPNAGKYTVGLLMGKDANGVIWILDVIRDRWDTSTRENTIEQTAQLDGMDIIVGIEQEPGSGGKESAENTAKRLMGYRVRIVRPSGAAGAKVIRADPFSTQVNAGNVRLAHATWNKAYIEELRYFPHGKYMDQVDGSSGAFTVISAPFTEVGSMY